MSDENSDERPNDLLEAAQTPDGVTQEDMRMLSIQINDAIPIEELEELADKWEQWHPLRKKCADDLRELIEEYK